MSQADKSTAAKKFISNWSGHGYEKGESQKFWIDLLTSVFGVSDIAQFIFFEEQVKDKILKHTTVAGVRSWRSVQNDTIAQTITNFIDAYIPSTRVMIEQKSSNKDLREPIKQSDGSLLTPFQQAKKYVADLPLSQHPKWIVTCNFDEFLIYDMENPSGEPQQLFLKDLEKKYHLLQFLVDQRKQEFVREEEISLKAGELVGKLYDALLPQYIKPDEKSLRSLNILCVRIVFCLYAEDAGLFETKTSFEDYIKSFAVENLRDGIIKLFKALDTKLADRDKYDTKLQPFPYVNGGLFRDEQIEIPNFTQEIVDVIVNHCAPFNWSEISPTIFGAVFESTLNPQTRRKGGMHYTSIANIHKVIDPLFMDELNTEFEAICNGTVIEQKNAVIEPVEMTISANKVVSTSSTTAAGSNHRKKLSPKERAAALHAFQKKLGSLTFLDPACGSGNFLTETYLSLRRLENRVISILNKGEKVLGFDDFIKVHINQFYGIEINDFAVTVAKTALWIAESQMVAETEAILSQNIDFLPLTNHANIIEGNALRLDWATLAEEEQAGFLFTEKLNVYKIDEDFGQISVHDGAFEHDGSLYGKRLKELNVVAKEVEEKEFPKAKKHERVTYSYIIGNPPFVGYTFQNDRQKADLKIVAGDMGKNIDYVAGWYAKAARLIQNTHTKCAFVSTNSITQGEQVAEVWKPLFEKNGIWFDFAWRTFIWDSESTQKAHVHCVILGFSHKDSPQKEKLIFDESGNRQTVQNINPYLLDAPTVFIEKRKTPLCAVSKIYQGSRPIDDGNLIILSEEYDEFIKKEPNAKKFIREFLGAEEFINGKKRYCLWLVSATPTELRKMPLVMKRIEAVKQFRESSKRGATRNLAAYPYLFAENRQPESGNYLLIPSVSSERRRYVPIGFLDASTVASNLVLIIPNATLYEFGILTSTVHNAWMRVVCGRLKSDYRYSNDIVYNNFPWCCLDSPSMENPNDEFSTSENSRALSAKTGTAHPCADYPICTASQKAKIEKTAQAILDARALFPDSSLADLYDESTMPPELRKAHRENDRAVMQAYGFKQGMEESEIVAELFRLYERLAKA